MALTERLALLVTLDARGAVQGLNQVASAADRGLGNAETRIDRTASKFKRAGAGMLAASGLAAAGLFKAGQAASNLEQAVGGTEAVFKDASGQIEKFAKTADQSMGLSERAFREATTSLGGQLKGVGFSIDEAASKAIELTQVGADLAATYGGTTADAVAALGSAFRGEADPAERFNLRLNQNTVNAKAVALGLAESTASVDAHAKAQATLALIMEQSTDAQGQFARESDSAAGAQARLQASLENMKAAIGGAVAPIIADLADGLGGLVDGFNSLPAPMQSTVSKVATFGTVALGAAGGLSFIIGKTLDFKSRLDDLAFTAPRAAGAISTLGKTALVVGGIIAVGEALDAAFNKDHTGDITEIENALARLGQGDAIDGLKLNFDELEDALGRVLDPNVGQSIDNFGENLVRSLPLIGHAAGSMAHGLQDAQEAIDGFDKGLAQLQARDPKLASAALSAAASRLGRPVSELMPLLDDYQAALTRADTDARTAADGTEAFGDAAGDAASPTQGLTDKIEDQKEAYEGLVDAQIASFNSNLGYREAVSGVAEAQKALSDAMSDTGKDADAERNAIRRLEDAHESHEDALKGVADAEKAVVEAQKHGTAAERDRAPQDLADAHERVADTARDIQRAEEDLAESRESHRPGSEEHERLVRNVEDAMLAQAEAAVRLAEDQAEANGGQLDGKQKAEIYRTELAKLAADLAPGSELRQRLIGYVAALTSVPETIETTVKLNVEGDALEALAGIIAAGPSASPAPGEQDALSGLVGVLGGTAPPARAGVNDITNNSALGGLVPAYLARGGFPGRRRGTDTIPSWLTPGEYVMPKGVVDRLGVPFFDALRAGNAPKYAPAGMGVDPEELAAAIKSALAEYLGGGDTFNMNFPVLPHEDASRSATRALRHVQHLKMALATR